jgi:hypothetical protein
MIRWPNGDTSVVGAPTKDEAMQFANDEWGDPYSGTEVRELKRFALDMYPDISHGRLGFFVDTGPFGGDELFHLVRTAAYPLVAEAENGATLHGKTLRERTTVLREALRLEKLRLSVRPVTKAVQ